MMITLTRSAPNAESARVTVLIRHIRYFLRASESPGGRVSAHTNVYMTGENEFPLMVHETPSEIEAAIRREWR